MCNIPFIHAISSGSPTAVLTASPYDCWLDLPISMLVYLELQYPVSPRNLHWISNSVLPASPHDCLLDLPNRSARLFAAGVNKGVSCSYVYYYFMAARRAKRQARGTNHEIARTSTSVYVAVRCILSCMVCPFGSRWCRVFTVYIYIYHIAVI